MAIAIVTVIIEQKGASARARATLPGAAALSPWSGCFIALERLL